MSEIRVTSVVGENGGDRVGLTTGLTVGPLTGTTGIGATITHHGHAQFAGVCTATSFTGNVTGNVTTNKIIPTGGVPSDSGTNPLYLGAGGVVQTVYAQTRSQQSTTSTSFVDANGMFVDITPKFSTSKMLITVSTVGQVNGNRARFDIHKSTTNSRISGHSGDNNQDYSISAFEGNNLNHSVNFSIMDIAGTTSNIRYKVQFNNTGGSTTFINASNNVGTLTVQELSA